ncbi:MAG: glycosyltransferase [Anaeroplasma sp.]
MNKAIPIFYATDNVFVKYTIVSMKSIIENSSRENHYKFHIMNTFISDDYKEIIKDLVAAYDNFEVEFVDVSLFLNSISDRLPIRDYYTKTTYYRFFIAEMFDCYEKAIYIDSDTIVKSDIANVYNTNLENNILGACHEQAMIKEDVYGNYVEINLGIERNNYFNAGFLLINIKKFIEECVLEQFIDLLGVYDFVVTQDEDYLNVICHNKVKWIEDTWNVEIFKEISYRPEEINMIHYIMWCKPWHFKNVQFEEYFWTYAKLTSVYEQIVNDLNSYTDEQRANDLKQADALMKLAISETNKDIKYVDVKYKKKALDRIKIQKKIELYEKTGQFDVDVENDPPSRVLLPNEVDYLKKKLSSKIKNKVAYMSARLFLNKIKKNKAFIIKKIKGIENLRDLTTGGIITCNHFNPFDSFAVEVAFNQVYKSNRLYRIIREGNYTSFGGFYGFLMRNCNTLPLSSNKDTMKNLFYAINKILKEKNFILVYPEQSMWWNYRKPKPLKKGAYSFATKNNVPIIPMFITMNDSNILDKNGYYVQEYTINISKPIYKREDLNNTQNIEYMINENFSIWKKIYEDTYKMELKY